MGALNDADLYNFLTIMRILITPISISIMFIALGSYLRFRNWRLLYLSVAFLLLSIPFAIDLLTYSGIESESSGWTLSQLYYISFIFSTASFLPFALLAYVYFDERRTQAIKITTAQWIIGGVLLLAQISFIVYTLLFNYSYSDSEFGIAPTLYLLNFILTNISYLLIILIAISLFSYYRAKKTKNTLIVMMGFVCLLFGQGYGVFNYLVHYLPSTNYSVGNVLVTSFELAGYIAFLIALLRLKVFR